MSDMNKQGLSTPPTSTAPVTLDQRMIQARSVFEVAFKNFHELLGDKILNENKSEAAKKVERHVVDGVVKSCVGLDKLNVGEGVMALAVVALREHLKVRDRVNELEYDLEVAKRDIKNIRESLGIGK